MKDSCHIADNLCRQPANFGDKIRVRLPRCYHCDEAVCQNCSELRTYKGRRVRLCADCVEELGMKLSPGYFTGASHKPA